MLIAVQRLMEYVRCASALGVTPADKLAIFWKETKNFRVKMGLDTYQPHNIFALSTVYGQIYFRDNFGDITNLPNLFYRQVYRVKTIDQPGAILDVGANIGLAAAWLAYHNPGREIHCFEPIPDNAAMIRMNCPSARVIQVALGAGRGKVSLSVDQHNVMASTLERTLKTRPIEFGVISLDEYCSRQNLEKIALIKLDAEGMEVEILNGARRTLENTHQVVMETHGQDNHRDVQKILAQAGFEIESQEFERQTGMIFASNCNRQETVS